MKTLIITDESWFKKASFQDIKMLGIRFLGIPADRFSSTQSEHFKRSLVRQVFVQKCDYGQVVTIEEINNQISTNKRKSKPRGTLPTGKYLFVQNRLRAPEGDIRHEMIKVLSWNNTFEDARADFDKKYGITTKFKSTGKLTFDFNSMVSWALKCGWIVYD